MTQVQFYHLTATPLERALPKIVEKAYAAGHRLHVALGSAEQAEYFNQLLWTYDPGSFLPHGTASEGDAEAQPVLLSETLEPVNGADILFVTEGSTPSVPEAYARILDMFDGKDASALEKARARWKQYKAAGHEVTYFRQTESGGWEKAA